MSNTEELTPQSKHRSGFMEKPGDMLYVTPFLTHTNSVYRLMFTGVNMLLKGYF